MLRLLRATLNSWNGLRAAARSERAFREEVVALLIAIPAAFLVATETWRRVALIGVVLGLACAYVLTKYLESVLDLKSMLYGVKVSDPVLLGLV